MQTLPQTLSATRETLEHLGRGARAVEVAGPWGSAKSLVATQVAAALRRPLLVVTPGRVEAEAVFDDLCTFGDPSHCALFPAWEVLPTDAMAPSDDIVAERMNTLRRMADELASGPHLRVVMPVRSLMQMVVRPEILAGQTVSLAVGEEHDLDELLSRLVHLGYERELMVEQRGQMSLRGCIFDVFPISSELPFRIEFFGDEIESIRRFEPETQRSIGHVDRIALMPRSEKRLLGRPDALAPLTDYLPDDMIVAIDEPSQTAEEARVFEGQFGDAPGFLPWSDLRERISPFTTLHLAQVAMAAASDTPRVTSPMRSTANWDPPAEDFWGQLEQWDLEGYRVVLACNNTGERTRMTELLVERGYEPGTEKCPVRLELGRLRAGFAIPAERLAILSEREVFGRHYVRRSRRRFEAGAAITAFSDLKAGDYIVHAHHGIGRYLGIRRFPDKAGEFLAIAYAKGDKLYLPASHIDAVQKFTGGDGALPKIDRLGGATWAKTKARVKKALRDMTEELVRLYAWRETQRGYAFGQDSPWQTEFEDAFEYEETVDQARAIEEVKRDMESVRPMDRLLCGDVGFGKTEVALRAAFKAVQDGKQAALLVPTTVLAEQHYLTFTERLADYPVSIDLLCRFRSPKEQKETIERLKSGEVDIVVGTHRLLSKDIQFKDLGLLVIDEEHRFGVAQKERLKQLRTSVDVLTMTATPIPRTLNLSLLGARDLSLINTAPNDRLPVHTCIEAFDKDLIREAITRELARQGQVFYLYNRVQTIHETAAMIRKLVPQARVAIGHGQMPEGELEQVMTRFIRNEVDVFVCTTIIGSGIDIPNANTIIIHDADRFGLSELYQLRGRVGRYKHRAFAYLLVPGDKALSEDAMKRLKALEDFSTLGAGFRIAMRDMEIRGTGNILGAEQHGYIISVGYETYCQLIDEAVKEIRGEPVIRRVLPPFEINIDAHIPEGYVPSEAQKITLYKRIAGVASPDEVDEMADEIADRFGPVPVPVRRLLDVMRVRAMAVDHGIRRVAAGRTALVFSFESGNLLNRRTRAALAETFGNALSFSWEDDPGATLLVPNADGPEALIKAARHFLSTLAQAEADVDA
jgi:transcription-repair coupling factor (superfamily II helicase)